MILPYLKQETFPLWLVKRPKDTVLVTILINESDNKFHYVNLTKSHICKCGFDTIDDALEDMKKLQRDGKVISFEKLDVGGI